MYLVQCYEHLLSFVLQVCGSGHAIVGKRDDQTRAVSMSCCPNDYCNNEAFGLNGNCINFSENTHLYAFCKFIRYPQSMVHKSVTKTCKNCNLVAFI